jgi:hypothetical protein
VGSADDKILSLRLNHRLGHGRQCLDFEKGEHELLSSPDHLTFSGAHSYVTYHFVAATECRIATKSNKVTRPESSICPASILGTRTITCSRSAG